MIISQKWLQQFVELPAECTPEVITQKLTDLGLEVEHVTDVAKSLQGFVIGRTLEVSKHPKADKLSVCIVDVGDGTNRTIVCGASNVAAQQTVAVALAGAVVPVGGFVIANRSLRGVESQGMICSQAELGLGEDSDGIWVLDSTLVPGVPLAQALGKTDVIYDIAITPNRADCLSHRGIARELQLLGATQTSSEWQANLLEIQEGKQSDLKVVVENPELCSLYMAQSITGVNVVPSPQWMQDALVRVGIKPRNVLVDVTNYVNMSLGQPLHAFDRAKLANDTIVVRTANNDTELVTLDEKLRTLKSDMLMICDAQKPIAIAGVMGGNNSEIDESTTSVVIESAYFTPSSIRKTSKTLALSTDASYRFERGVDRGAVREALNLAAQLIITYAGGKAEAVCVVGDDFNKLKNIDVRPSYLNQIVGIEMSTSAMIELFEKLGCEVQESNNILSVQPPTWRADLEQEIDFAEEVMRYYGVNNVPAHSHANIALHKTPIATTTAIARTVRTRLVARGYMDCISNVLVAPEVALLASSEVVQLKNALSLEYSSMRTSIIPNLISIAAQNVRNGSTTQRLMEVGKVFERANNDLQTRETDTLTLVITGIPEQHWSSGKQQPLDVYDLLADIQSVVPNADILQRSEGTNLFSANIADVVIGNNQVVGVVGQILPSVAEQLGCVQPVYAAQILLVPLSEQRIAPTFASISVYPGTQRDLALIVNKNVLAQQLLDTVKSSAGGLLRSVHVFDVYTHEEHVGVDKKSIGISLHFGAHHRTLVEKEVEEQVKNILEMVVSKHGALVRGVTVQ